MRMGPGPDPCHSPPVSARGGARSSRSHCAEGSRSPVRGAGRPYDPDPFHAQIADENGQFDISDVISSISRRWFAGIRTSSDATADSRKPCPRSGTTSSERSKTGIRPADRRRPKQFPPSQSVQATKKAARVGSTGRTRNKCWPKSGRRCMETRRRPCPAGKWKRWSMNWAMSSSRW
jgi:hypothetical protein